MTGHIGGDVYDESSPVLPSRFLGTPTFFYDEAKKKWFEISKNISAENRSLERECKKSDKKVKGNESEKWGK